MEALVYICRACGQKNRIAGPMRREGLYKCGACGAELLRRRSNHRRLLILASRGLSVFSKLFGSDVFKAAARGEVDSVRSFLESGVPVNGRDRGGWPALRHAVSKGHLGLAAYLLSVGADVNLPDKGGLTPLFSVPKGNLPIASLLLMKGASINITTTHGFTPLMLALEQGDEAFAQLLIIKGANLNVQEKLAGGSALLTAVRNGLTRTVVLMLTKHANPNVRANTGFTPLMAATHRKDHELIRFLIAFGANPHAVDELGSTALTHAEVKKDYETASLLRAQMGEKDKRYLAEKALEHVSHILDILKPVLGV